MAACNKCIFSEHDRELRDYFCRRQPPRFRHNCNYAPFPKVRSYDWCGEFKEEKQEEYPDWDF